MDNLISIFAGEANCTNCTTNSTNATNDGMMPPSGGSTVLQDVLNTLMIVLITIVMVGMGCAVVVDKLIWHLKRPTGILTGFFIQFGKFMLHCYLSLY